MINTERLLREFEALVAIDCESFHEGAMRDHLREKLLALGLTVSEDEAAQRMGSGPEGAGNLLGRLNGKEEGVPLLFSLLFNHAVKAPDGIGFQPAHGAASVQDHHQFR
jgi:tripeptide aminopeptidase